MNARWWLTKTQAARRHRTGGGVGGKGAIEARSAGRKPYINKRGNLKRSAPINLGQAEREARAGTLVGAPTLEDPALVAIKGIRVIEKCCHETSAEVLIGENYTIKDTGQDTSCERKSLARDRADAITSRVFKLVIKVDSPSSIHPQKRGRHSQGRN